MKVYVAAALRDEKTVSAIYDELRARGHVVTYDWVSNEGRHDVWDDARRREVAEAEVDGVFSADAMIFIAPGGRGAHVELGLATGVPVLFCCEEEPKSSLFYYHPKVTKLRSKSVAEIVNQLEKENA